MSNCIADPRWTLVELIPDLYMERVYEDHENLVENCLMWTVDSKNTLWFIERPEKYDVFVRPERYLLGTSSSQQGDTMEDHARQELLEEYFSSTGKVATVVYFSSDGSGMLGFRFGYTTRVLGYTWVSVLYGFLKDKPRRPVARQLFGISLMILESGACSFNPIFRLISGTTRTQCITTGNYSVFYIYRVSKTIVTPFVLLLCSHSAAKKTRGNIFNKNKKMEHIPYNIFSIILTNALIIIRVWEILNGRK